MHKIEGLGLRSLTPTGAALIGVVDDDDPLVPSARLAIRLDW